MLFLPCLRGLEPLLVREIEALGIAAKASYCGAYVEQMDLKTILTLNYCCRFASRVLFPLGRFKVYDQDSLHKRAKAIPWENFFKHEKMTVAVDANVQHPKFRNSLFAAQVLKDAVCDRLRDLHGWRPSVDTKEPDIQLNLFIHEEWATVSFDTSGLPLFKRGWRTASVQAPLQETLGAALLAFAGYTGEGTLCDPCCGSGTILIEAAMIATKTPPGYFRKKWGFTLLPEFDQILWDEVRSHYDRQITKLKGSQISGSDIDPKARQAAQANAKAADFPIPIMRKCTQEADLIVTNPPFGVRMGKGVEFEHFLGKRKVILFPKEEQVEGKVLGAFSNGGIPCVVVELFN
ncbi:MAG: 50S rRNA methyltransferase [Verrucomicrobia bacterium]|nr:50S rRNA methyltransferase [Verrucomicrobiota bacterium]